MWGCKIKLICNSIFKFLLIFFPHLCGPVRKSVFPNEKTIALDDYREVHISMEQLSALH